MTINTQRPLRGVYLLGTAKKGCTAHFGEYLIERLTARRACEIKRFVLPKDGPEFCTGCTLCFMRGMESCPHAKQVQPLWQAMCEADVLILAQPTYAFGAPAQVKALLEHLACRWLVHSPEKRMLNKQVFILSQAVGAGMGKAAKQVKTCFRFLGCARIRTCTFSVGHTDVKCIASDKRKTIEGKLDRFAEQIASSPDTLAPSLFTRMMFPLMRKGHTFFSQQERKQGREDTYDYIYWKQQGWIDKQWPWKE